LPPDGAHRRYPGRKTVAYPRRKAAPFAPGAAQGRAALCQPSDCGTPVVMNVAGQYSQGTNQYRARPGVPARWSVPDPVPGLLAQIADLRPGSAYGSGLPAGQLGRLCGEVWGGGCRTLVRSPTWAHGEHPGLWSLASKGPPGHSRAFRNDFLPNVDCRPVFSSAQVATRALWAAAGDLATSPQELGQLALSENLYVRVLAGGNPACPADALLTLSRDELYVVRQAVARNPNCTAGLLGYLGGDQRADVRQQVAASRVAPPEILATLLNDPAARVRAAALNNPALPRHILAMWQLASR